MSSLGRFQTGELEKLYFITWILNASDNSKKNPNNSLFRKRKTSPVKRHISKNRYSNGGTNTAWNRLNAKKTWTEIKLQYGQAKINALKKKCSNGHPFNKQNTLKTKQGKRQCKKCRRIYMQGYYNKVVYWNRLQKRIEKQMGIKNAS